VDRIAVRPLAGLAGTQVSVDLRAAAVVREAGSDSLPNHPGIDSSQHPTPHRRGVIDLPALNGAEPRLASVCNGDRMVRVLVADADAVARSALRAALLDAGLSVVGQAADASQALYLARRCRPDVVVFDATIAPGGGVEALRALTAAAPDTRVVLLARAVDNEHALAALSSGAAGYLSRGIKPASLARAVGRVAAGEAAISRALALCVVERLRELTRGCMAMRPVRSQLTTREWEILDLLIAGASTAAIARELFITPDTVRSHVSHKLRKLDVASRQEAVEVARQLRGHRN
jgi:DNA-binding NarL/FixJ family response regulator